MHHKRFSFQDEYRQFLLSYGVEYDEAYVLIKAFALSGRGDSTMRKPQGVASLALGYVLHWAFSPSLLNPKPQGVASLALGLCAPLGLQPVLAKSETPGCRFACPGLCVPLGFY